MSITNEIVPHSLLFHRTKVLSWKTAISKEMMTKPTTKPSIKMRAGSRSDTRAFKLLSTSRSRVSATVVSDWGKFPASSPTATSRVKSGGKTPTRLKWSATLSPSRTLCLTSSKALAKTSLPTTSLATSNASRTGTPPISNTDSALAKRPIAAFKCNLPKIGSLNFQASVTNRPLGVLRASR
jgi:hypothetical protein